MGRSAAESRAPAPLRRDPDRGLVAGVCAGLAERLGLDVLLVRLAVAIVVIATGGAAALGYLIAWVAIPAGGDHERERTAPERPAPAPGRAPRAARGRTRVALGAGLLMLALLLSFRELGIWWSDALIWPLVLATSGAALLWRQSREMQPLPADQASPAREAAPPAPARRRAGPADLYRGGFGIALVAGAALLFLSANDALGATRDAVLAAVVAVFALALILAPFLWRLGRSLAAERTARIRSQERAELAAHLHDSVLQTLALIQKQAAEPRRVATLARRQERELRGWLAGAEGPREGTLGAELERVAAAVEAAHDVTVELVIVGDRELGSRGSALVAATGEALTNAAKFAGEAGAIAVYAELAPQRATVFVRDRGPGFDPGAVPEDRRGLRESVLGRMTRHGGHAQVRSTLGGGTEIELAIEAEEDGGR